MNRSFYSCVLSDLAFECKWGWIWPCFDTDLSAFSFKCQLVSILKNNLIYTTKAVSSVWKQGHLQPLCHSKKGPWAAKCKMVTVTSRVHQTYLAIAGVMGCGPYWQLPEVYKWVQANLILGDNPMFILFRSPWGGWAIFCSREVWKKLLTKVFFEWAKKIRFFVRWSVLIHLINRYETDKN